MKLPQAVTLPRWLEQTLLWSLVAIFVLMPVHAFISTWGGTAIGPLWLWKSWKELLLGLLFILLGVGLISRPKLFYRLLSDRLLQVVAAFALWFFLMLLLESSHEKNAAVTASVAFDLRYFAIFVLGYVTAAYGGMLEWPKWRERIVMFLIVAGTLLAIFGILQATILPKDLLVPFGYDKATTIAPYTLIDRNPNAPRAFATLRGPNDFGAFLILPILLCLTFIRRAWWAWMAAGIMLIGLFYSASRSAWAGMAVAIVAWLALRYGRTVFRSRRAIVIGLMSLLGVVVIMIASLSLPAVRLAVFHSQPSDRSLTQGSTDQHFSSSYEGARYVAEHPEGCGPGCAGPASYYSGNGFISENYYLQIAEEVGVIGLGLWLAVAIMTIKKLYRATLDRLAAPLLASFLGISLIGLLLHVWADDPLSLTWWLAASLVIGNSRRTQIAKKPTLH